MWNATGDFGLDPGPEKFLLQRTNRTMGEIWIKSVVGKRKQYHKGWEGGNENILLQGSYSKQKVVYVKVDWDKWNG